MFRVRSRLDFGLSCLYRGLLHAAHLSLMGGNYRSRRSRRAEIMGDDDWEADLSMPIYAPGGEPGSGEERSD